MIRLLKRGLSLRLFILIYAIMLISFGIYTVQILQRHRSDLMDAMFANSQRISDCIRRSTRYSMMLNQMEDVQQIIYNLGQEQGVESVRVYNKTGEIIFSSYPEERHNQLDISNKVCVRCHTGERPLPEQVPETARKIIKKPSGERVLAVSNPIYNDTSCATAPCHAHSDDPAILGITDVHMSLVPIDQQLRESRRGIVANALYIVLGLAFAFGLLIYFGFRERIKRLIEGTHEVSSGNLDYKIDIRGHDEVGVLAHSFNKMTHDLKKARQEITEWSNHLETKVEKKTSELERAQQHIVQMEKLASLGKLSAVMAHEINNPLAGSLNYTVLSLRALENEEINEERREKVLKYLGFVKGEIFRVGSIVKNMLVFAKQTGGDFTELRLHDLIESAVMLVNHQLELKNIELDRQLSCENDKLVCDGGQIRQALVALFINAIEAMNEDGQLFVRTTCSDDQLFMEIEDTGVGIPEENVRNIFDPFFSTKKEGKGVGLGLSVVYGIIERHKGKITVESKENQGTTFFIQLPRVPDVENDVKVTPNL